MNKIMAKLALFLLVSTGLGLVDTHQVLISKAMAEEATAPNNQKSLIDQALGNMGTGSIPQININFSSPSMTDAMAKLNAIEFTKQLGNVSLPSDMNAIAKNMYDLKKASPDIYEKTVQNMPVESIKPMLEYIQNPNNLIATDGSIGTMSSNINQDLFNGTMNSLSPKQVEAILPKGITWDKVNNQYQKIGTPSTDNGLNSGTGDNATPTFNPNSTPAPQQQAAPQTNITPPPAQNTQPPISTH
jgi:hypothetical protein